MAKQKQEGFTIVELLIVIVVIAILAAISLVAYNGFMARAQTSVLKSDLSNGASAVAASHAINGTYPNTLGDASQDVGDVAPSTGSSYVYVEYDSGNSYCLAAIGFEKSFFVSNDSPAPSEGGCGDAVTCTDLVVGDSGPGGGIIFYKSGSTCYESARAGWNGASSDPNARYGCYGVDIPGADSSSIGGGQQNTADMLAAGCSGTSLAAVMATSYRGGGLNDWYVPSRGELNQMYIQRNTVGGFTSQFYRSSTETPPHYAQTQHFGDGRQGGYGTKNDTFPLLRPIRSFTD